MSSTNFKKKLEKYKPLQVVGVINAYCALLAEQSGHNALYLSGAGVANACFGLPDLAITTMNDVVLEAKKICDRTSLPLLVDIDTGFGGVFSIVRTIKEMSKAGVAAVHIEDQISTKRCGHRPNKEIVDADEMCDRIKSAVDARENDLFILARTDALHKEETGAVLDRCHAYIKSGADGIFLEAVNSIDMYATFRKELGVPILANITEFGKTPLYTLKELNANQVDIALYPLSAFRAMSKAALNVYDTIKQNGTQASLIEKMQTREELYTTIGYHEYEDQLDKINSNK